MAWELENPKLTADNFWAEVAAHPIVVVHFWATWNQSDRMMDGVTQNVRPEFEAISFFAFDSGPEESWDILHHLGIYSLPTLICFLNGQEHARSVGYLNPKLLRAKLREWLAAST